MALSRTQRRAAGRDALRTLRSASLRTETVIPLRYTSAGLVNVEGVSGPYGVINYSPFLPRLGARRPGVVTNGAVGFVP